MVQVEMTIVWTGYRRYRAALRGFELDRLEGILRHSNEWYQDTVTGRMVVVGRHGKALVVVPYEVDGERVTPVTVHVSSRQQVRFRSRSGRWVHV